MTRAQRVADSISAVTQVELDQLLDDNHNRIKSKFRSPQNSS